MDVLWIVLGIVILVLTLLDTFLAVLNYDESGLFVDKFTRWQWLLMRTVTRRVSRRWRRVVLRQVTGVLVLSTIVWWLLGIILGYAFIYLGAMLAGDGFQISTGVSADFLGAFYLSVGQFATVGVDNISPGIPVLNLLTVSEAMVSIVLLSFIISFLSSVYGVVQSLRAFCANFFRIGHGIGDPIDTLAPFFPDGRARGLDGQLGGIVDSLSAYAEGVAQNRAAYYFQSGRDQFSLPFALYMTTGVIGALRWGLPAGSDPSKEPDLVRLMQSYEEFRLQLQRMLRLQSATPPAPVSPADFGAAVTAFESSGSDARSDPWVLRFLAIDRRMAEMTRSSAPIDAAEAYRRYTEWLPFEVRARSFCAAIGRDLDYQPIYRAVATTPDGIPLDAVDASTLPDVLGIEPNEAEQVPPRRHRNALGQWIRRRHLFIDPGLVRLTAALRSLAAVVLAVAVVLPLASFAHVDSRSAAVFAGLIALFSGAAAPGRSSRPKWWAGAVTAVPAVVGASLGVLIPRDPVSSVFELAAVAALAMWMRRFGPAVGGLGQLAFVTYYITLLLDLDASDLPAVLIAVAVGVVCTWIVGLIPGPSVRRQINGGVSALYERIALLTDTMIDLVSTGRHDARLVRSLRAEQSALMQTAGSVGGQLDVDAAPGIPPARVRALRVRVFDLQLAAQSLVTLLPVTSSIAISVEQRARLAADLIDVQEQLKSYRSGAGAKDRKRHHTTPDPSAEWPPQARRILETIAELRTAIDRLREAQIADDLDPHAFAEPADGESVLPAPAPADARQLARAADKQAVQAAISTGLALFLGGFLSTSHQYWAAMPAFQVLSGSDAETRSKGFQRIIATIVGSGIAFGLAILAGHDPAVAIPLLIVSAFFMSFVRGVSSAWMAFWVTVLLATVYDVLGTLSVQTVEVRLAETAIGALIAVVVSAIVLPTRTRTRVLRGMAGVVQQAGVVSQGAFARILGAETPTGVELSRATRALDKQLGSLEKIADPIRHNPGSLQSTGIEAQLTCLWALLDYEGHLVRRLRRFSPDAADTTRWRELSTATADNFDAVRSVLTGSLPQRVHPPAEFEEESWDPGSKEGRAVLREVQRLNQTLLALTEAVAPGTVESMTNPDAAHDDADGSRSPTRV